MAKVLVKGSIIANNQVLNVAIYDETDPNFQGKQFQITVLDRVGNRIESESRLIEVSQKFLSTFPTHLDDLLSYLIQFRKTLPSKLITSTIDPFKYPDWTRNKKLVEVGNLIKDYFRELPDVPLYPETIRNSITIEFFEILTIFEYYEKNEVVTGFELGSNAVTALKGIENRLSPILTDLEKSVSNESKGQYELKAEKGEFVLVGSDAHMTRKCQAGMQFGKSCDRTFGIGDKCLLHSQDENKDIHSFESLLQETLADRQSYFDFTGFVFPRNFQFKKNFDFENEAYFENTIFYGYADLSKRKFKKSFKIINSKFHENVSFANCEFLDNVEISLMDTKLCTFEKSIFRAGFVLEDMDPKLGQLRTTDFTGATFDKPNLVKFRKVFFPQFLFEDCNVSDVEFFHIWGSEEELKGLKAKDKKQKKWYRLRRIWGQLVKRAFPVRNFSYVEGDEFDGKLSFKLGDEYGINEAIKSMQTNRQKKAQIRRVIECYQRLQANFLKNKNYKMAGMLHRREMELERLKYGVWGRIFSFHALYRWFAGYCESITWPIIVLTSCLFVAPIVLTLFMGDPDSEMTSDWSYFPESVEVLCRDFIGNLDRITTNDKNVFKYKSNVSDYWTLFFILERVFYLLQVSFIVIAFRRKFRKY